MKNLKCLKWLDCVKCGARNYGKSKHKPVVNTAGVWCGHCGCKLTKEAAQ